MTTPQTKTFGEITVETTKRYVQTFGPQNIIKESNNRKAPESEWTVCKLVSNKSKKGEP